MSTLPLSRKIRGLFPLEQPDPQRVRSPRRGYRWVALACLFLAAGCTKTSVPPGGGTGSDRIVIGTTAKFRTLDPADSYEVLSGNLLYNLGDRLYDYDQDTGKLKPKLATALPQVSNDGLTYDISLRKGVKFHDGTPFDAKAMAFSLNRFIKNGGNPSGLLGDPVKSIEAKGDLNLTITLKKPFAAFPNLLAFSGLVAVSPKAYKEGAGQFLPNQFIGTGPYKLVKASGDSIRMEVFDQYWDKKPTNKGVNIQVFSSPANLFNAFRTGSVDVAYISLDPDQIQVLESDAKKGNWQAITSPSNFITFLMLNTKDPALSKVKVRQALAAMIDRDTLNQRVFKGQAQSLYTLVPSIFEGTSQPVFKDQRQQLKNEGIRNLLKESGYSSTKPLKLNLWYRSNLTSDGVAASTIKAMVGKDFSDIVQLELNSIDSATAYKNLDKGTYPMFMLDWAGDYYDPDTYLQPFLSCEKGSPKTGCQKGQSQSWGSFFYSPEANTLIDQSRKTTDPGEREKLFGKLQTLLGKEVPYIPLWQKQDYIFAQKGVQGVQLQRSQQFPFWPLNKK